MPVADSPPPTLRARLLAAARIELAEVGLERLTVRGVARRANVSHAAPGYEFGGRPGMLTALAADGYRELRAALDAVPDSPEAAPALRLAELGEAYVHFAESEPGLFGVMFDEPSVDRTNLAFRAASEAALAVLSERLSSTLVVDPSVAWALAHGVAVLLRSGALAGLGGDSSHQASRILNEFAELAGCSVSEGPAR